MDDEARVVLSLRHDEGLGPKTIAGLLDRRPGSRDGWRLPRGWRRLPCARDVGQVGPSPSLAFALTGLGIDAQEELVAALERHLEAILETIAGRCAIAAGSLLVELLAGAALRDARDMNAARLDRALGGLPRHKTHCARLAAEALSAALASLERREGPA